MTAHRAESSYMKHANEILESARGKTLSLNQREMACLELSSAMLHEANQTTTHEERKTQNELARMMLDPKGKAFTTCMTDQCFRSHRPARIAFQLVYLLDQFGIPKYLGFMKRFSLLLFQMFGQFFSFLFVPVTTFMLRRATSKVILPGEARGLKKHILLRRAQGVRLNINHLGEAILGEEEAKTRLNAYLEDLKRDDIEYVSIKISTIYSQIQLLGWEATLDVLADRLKLLYRAAMTHNFIDKEGRTVPKFVNLDMEEYKDLDLTKELFKKVLNEPEFHLFSAGIVLQAYLPDAHAIQKELTEWAMQRISKGGAPVKIRIVKGANLAMEQFEASLKGWEQAPYKHKSEVDANYKRMVTYGCLPPHARAVHLGIGSHNLFDISYAMLLRAENGVEKEISFEMLEGMADHIRRVVQKLTKSILLYCPIAKREDFQSAIAYLIRRLDENTGPDNFLRATFGLKPGSTEWDTQVLLFSNACQEMNRVYMHPRRTQNRLNAPQALLISAPFENESDTDFALPKNRHWAYQLSQKWKNIEIKPIPLVIGGKEISQEDPEGKGYDPIHLNDCLYRYSIADWHLMERAIACAKDNEAAWASKSVDERCHFLSMAAQKMRAKKDDLIGVMMIDGGKTILEGDPEVSEAIDFAEYYLRSLKKMHACSDLSWKPKGTVLVTPPWNFPVSIPAGGILAALAMGNCVIFKPAPEAVLSGWILVNALWDAGIPREVLQFVNCVDDPTGSQLIADPRINMIVLTGATATAHLFLKLRPGLDLAAETGGKNAMIITSMADRDLAIKDLIHSSFSHSGQKCSACSLAILQAEVYDDLHFRKQLKDAVESLKVGACWDPVNKIIPLIHAPNETLLKGLTTLEKGEEWLVEPKQDPLHPNLWSPGVKLGVRENSFMHTTELFGPVLSLMRANTLSHAIDIANATPYGLTSGLQSLDEREQSFWMGKIEAGNCYINRTTTGAIVRRQPFGGTKSSSFGAGAKAGGPNYLSQFATATQVSLPQDKHPISEEVNSLTPILKKLPLSAEELGIWFDSITNYAVWAKRFEKDHDSSKVVGQDNLFRYHPHKRMCLHIQNADKPLDVLRSIAAAMSCKSPLQISWNKENPLPKQLLQFKRRFHFIQESEIQFCERVKRGEIKRVRLLSPPSKELILAASQSACYLNAHPVLANGRFELLHYLREIAISIDYHRYGNLGLREKELRKTIQ